MHVIPKTKVTMDFPVNSCHLLFQCCFVDDSILNEKIVWWVLYSSCGDEDGASFPVFGTCDSYLRFFVASLYTPHNMSDSKGDTRASYTACDIATGQVR